jgi:ferritin-like metal-binding protein YciE
MPTTKPGKTTRSSSSKSSSKANRAVRSKTAKSGQSEDSNGQLEKFFIDQLKDIYWAEKHLIKSLPKMQKAATSGVLQEAIQDHLAQTEEQAARLEEVFELMGQKPVAKKCEGMEGLVKEAESAVEETEEGSMTRDAAIIMSAQKVEHYEIASYGTLVQLATIMGNEEVAGILQTTLDEEKETDENLTTIAEEEINWKAAGEEEGETEEEE